MSDKSLFFVKTPFVMDKMEKHFYDVLLHAADEQYYVWPKVHLANLLQPKNESEEQELYKKFNHLADKHIDFVLCDKEKFHPILVIRFMGMVSDSEDVYRKEMDILKDILEAAEIPLLIESATELDSYKSDLEYETLRERISDAIKAT